MRPSTLAFILTVLVLVLAALLALAPQSKPHTPVAQATPTSKCESFASQMEHNGCTEADDPNAFGGPAYECKHDAVNICVEATNKVMIIFGKKQ